MNKAHSRHTFLDMSFFGCLLTFILEICAHDFIFIPLGGGASFGLIVLIVINSVAIPAVMALLVFICYWLTVPRSRKNCLNVFILSCTLTLVALFIAYPMGR